MHVLITEDDWGGQEEARGGEVGDVLEGGEGETKRSGNQEQELENWEVAATAAAAAPFSASLNHSETSEKAARSLGPFAVPGWCWWAVGGGGGAAHPPSSTLLHLSFLHRLHSATQSCR